MASVTLPRHPEPPVGRADELAVLNRLAAAARRDTDLRVALVSGDAGMGKSHLVAAFAAELEDALVLVGECLDLDGAARPWAPLVQALRPVLRDPTSDAAAALDDPARAALSRLVPELGVRPERAQGLADIDVGQTQLYEHLLALLERLGRRAGLLVLVIEDLHFSEPSTRDLLAFLSQNLTDAPVLLVATVRGDEITRRHPAARLLTALRRGTRTTELVLGPLGPVAMTQLLRPLCEHLPDQHAIDEVLDRADGNPFFGLELARSGRQVPDHLGDLLLDRFDELAEPTREVLRIVAAAGDSIGHDLLRRITGMDETAATRALREAIDHRLLVVTSDGTYRFRHALLQEVVHDLLLPGEATRLHQALAAALEADGGLRGRHAAAIARHHQIAGDAARGLEASFAAGVAALDAVAYVEAQRHFERVAQLWPDVPDADARTGTDLAEVLKKAALCAISGDDGRRGLLLARQALTHLDPDADPRRRALIQMWIGHGMQHFGEPSGVDAYRTAVAMVGEEPSSERARVLAALAKGLMVTNDTVAAEQVATESIAVARAVGSSRDEAYSLITLGTIEMERGDLEVGRDHLEEGKRLAADLGRIDYVLRAHTNLSHSLMLAGQLEGSVAVAQRGVALARANGLLRTHGVYQQGNMVEALVPLGQLAEAVELAEENVALAPDGLSGSHAYLGQAEARLLLGDVDAAAAAVASAKRHARASAEPQFTSRAAVVSAGVQQALGNHGAALAEARTALADLVDGEGPAGYEAALAVLVLEAALALASTAPVPEEVIAEVIATVDAATVRGQTMLHVAHAARLSALAAQLEGADAREAWRAAAAVHDEMGLAPGQARCLLSLAEAALDAGDRAEAQEAWKAATRVAEDIGAGRLAMAAVILGRRGGFLDPDRVEDPYGLTNREMEVLRLVADGLSNAQIGAELFITGKTASVHVSNILAKMGVASRGQAAAEAHRAGLFG